MTLSIGSSPCALIPHAHSRKRRRGFSFFEVMVTISILSVGMLTIYRAFFLSLNYLNHMTYRLYANVLLDNKIAQLERRLRAHKEIPTAMDNEVQSIRVKDKVVDFEYTINFNPQDPLSNLYQLDLSILWKEGSRSVRLFRSVYVADLAVSEEP